MSQNIVSVGIDVDDVSYHGCAMNKRSGEVLDFHCRPTLKVWSDNSRSCVNILARCS